MKKLAAILIAVSVLTLNVEAHGPSYAMLKRRFDTGRIGERQREYLWTLKDLQRMRPELRESGALITWRLSAATSGDPNTPEWVVRKGGWPVKPLEKFLTPEPFVAAVEDLKLTQLVTLAYKGAPEIPLLWHWAEDSQGNRFEYFLVQVKSGRWKLETKKRGGEWLFVREMGKDDLALQWRDEKFPCDFRLSPSQLKD